MFHNGSLRLKGFAYTQGAFFITINTYRRRCIFGEVKDKVFYKSVFGEIVESEWLKTASMRPYIELDVFQIMPEHFHAIVILHDELGSKRTFKFTKDLNHFSPFAGQSKTLGNAIGQFKASVTRRINEIAESPGNKIWHPDYYDYVIRNFAELKRIRNYIQKNPMVYEEKLRKKSR
ncbi:MAG: transposase [Bacteroidetes bacterium]|nr:transposase [Bacteroidota bacterium]